MVSDLRAEAKRLLGEMDQDIRAEAETLLGDPDLIERIIDDVAALGVAGERDLVGMIYLVGTSRLLAKPLAVIVQGLSSSGKSYLIENTVKLFPDEAVIHATGITPQALQYMPSGSLSHRFIVAGERSKGQNDEASETTKGLREMLSSGKLTRLTTIKGDTGFETRHQVQKGPIAYIESTSLKRIFPEDANRCVILTTDERQKQTENIVGHLASGYVAGERLAEVDGLIERHHALQRMLKPLVVVIPYAGKVGKLFKTERVEARRAFPHFMNVIQTSALLYQRQRCKDERGRLVATRDDYYLAYRLVKEPMSKLLAGGISVPVQEFYESLQGRFSGKKFTTKEAEQGAGVGERTVRNWLYGLRDAGLVVVVSPGVGPQPAKWGFTKKKLDEGGVTGLPSPEEVFGGRE